MNEASAIIDAQNGNHQGFTFLHNLHRTNVLRQCIRLLRNETEAEDACQEIFLKLFLKIRMYRGEAKFSVWLYSLAERTCFDIMRAKGRAIPEDRRPYEPWGENPRGSRFDRAGRVNGQRTVLHSIPCRSFNPERTAILNDTFARLPEEAKIAFNANVVHGHLARQVCRTTGIPSEARVFKHRRHAQRELRQALA